MSITDHAEWLGRARDFWSGLSGVDVSHNTRGNPPYDLDEVGEILWDRLDLAPGADVLDLGCGTGDLAAWFATRGVGVVGVDIAQPMIDAFHDRTGDGRMWGYLTPGDGIPSAVQRRWFGIRRAYSVTMFQHVPDTVMDAYLVDLAEMMLPGGTFVFTHSLGDERAPLSFQTTVDRVLRQLDSAGFHGAYTGTDDLGWSWFTAWRR